MKALVTPIIAAVFALLAFAGFKYDPAVEQAVYDFVDKSLIAALAFGSLVPLVIASLKKFWAGVQKAIKQPHIDDEGGYVRREFVWPLALIGLALSIVVLSGCQAVGPVAVPNSLDQRLAAGLISVTSTREACANGFEAKALSRDAAVECLNYTDHASTLLSAARLFKSEGNTAAAEDRIAEASRILQTVQRAIEKMKTGTGV